MAVIETTKYTKGESVKRIYIAGPMRGIEGFNRAAFTEYDHARTPYAIELARTACDRMDKEAEIRYSGNCAKLREVLVSVQEKIHYLIGTLNVPNSLVANRMEINGIINAALAAPPRNCDRFASAEEAWDAYDEWVESYRSKGKVPPFNEFGWLYAPATEKEGGAKCERRMRYCKLCARERKEMCARRKGGAD